MSNDDTTKCTARQHALVIGGSMAGLMTAKALSQSFEKVTIIDRDRFPENPEFRKGAPQAAHVHVLLSAGTDFINSLYPQLFEELEPMGARLIDTANEFAWFHEGVWKNRYESGIKIMQSSRVLLEWGIRRHTAAVDNIEILP